LHCIANCDIMLSDVSRLSRKLLTMARKTQDSFTVVTSHLGELSVGELEEVGVMVEALLAIRRREAAVERVAEETVEQPAAKGPGGYLEAKTINGCGPYLYLRYWAGKTHKSKYVGKAPKG